MTLPKIKTKRIPRKDNDQGFKKSATQSFASEKTITYLSAYENYQNDHIFYIFNFSVFFYSRRHELLIKMVI